MEGVELERHEYILSKKNQFFMATWIPEDRQIHLSLNSCGILLSEEEFDCFVSFIDNQKEI